MVTADKEARPRFRFFPAQVPGNCPLCGKPFAKLAMVGFYPAGQISHLACIQNPPKPKQVESDPKIVDFLAAKLAKLVNQGCEPKHYQIAFVEYAELRKGRVLCGDEMGTGKTVEVILWLALHPEIRPVVLVVPNSVKLNWPIEIKKWLPGNPTVHVLEGTKPKALPKADFYVLNYDIAHHWRAELSKLRAKCLVTDESHYLQNPKAKRTQAVLGNVLKEDGKPYLAKGVPHFLATSGTPIVNRPVEFYPVLHRLSQGAFGSYWDFVYRYCAAYKQMIPYGPRGFDGSRRYREILNVSGASNIAELNQRLVDSVMIRRLKADILSELPEKQRSIIPMDIQNRAEYQRAERDFLAWLRESGADKEKLDRAAKAEFIVRVNALTRLAATGKLANVIEWCKDFLATGEKLVVFGHHRSVGIALSEALAEFKPAILFGDIDAKRMQAEKERFQSDPACRVAVCSHKKAGEGITLTAASNMAIVELPWTPGSLNQSEDRIHRIGQQNACTIYYLLADRTVEQDKCAKLDQKRGVIAGVLDNRALTDGESLVDALLGELAKRAEKTP